MKENRDRLYLERTLKITNTAQNFLKLLTDSNYWESVARQLAMLNPA